MSDLLSIAAKNEGVECIAYCEKVYSVVSKLGLRFTGPWHFIAYGLPQDIETKFEIEFCLPVSGLTDEVAEQEVQVDCLDGFYCASREFKGKLSKLFELGYQPLINDINSSNGSYSGESREVYHVWGSPESEGNVIEIQFRLVEI